MKTLLLDRDLWDLCRDAQGNIAVAADPYSTAQDAASEVRTFRGEAWYDTARGIPYFSKVLGKLPPIGFLKAQITAAVNRTPEIKSVKVFLSAITSDRILTGQIQITHTSGAVTVLSFGPNSEGTGIMSPGFNILVDPFGNFVRSLSRPAQPTT